MADNPHVVFLANDAVLSQGLAFLESFRTTNPSLPLSMIPFADDIAEFAKLQSTYDFDILTVQADRWDNLSREFFPGAIKKYLHRLRKLSIFDVKAPATIYLDLDMVVLKDLRFLAEPIIRGEVDFICTATLNDPWVYKPNFRDYPKLRNARRFSDGFFVFGPKRITADLAYDTVVANKDLYLTIRADEVYCQPITNFIVDMLGLRIGEVWQLFPSISPQVWYAEQKLSWVDGRVLSEDGKEVLFVHWAGPVEMAEGVPFRELFQTYYTRAVSRAEAAGIVYSPR